MQVMEVSMDIDICLMSQARLVGEKDHYTAEFHDDGIAGKVPAISMYFPSDLSS